MDRVSPGIRNEYERWKKLLITDDDLFAGERTIGIDDVLRAHFILCDYFLREGENIALAGPRDENLLISAIGRQFTGYADHTKWTDDFERCATLFWGLIRNHPFHDGNKRTALLVALYHLAKLNRVPELSQRELETLAVRTASNRLDHYTQFKRYINNEPEVLFIADYFRKNTRPVDKRQYLLTYNQLDGILRRFGYRLDNASGNYIDVVRTEEKKKGFLRKRTVTERKMVIQIGFPGWTKQVTKRAISCVRKAAKLTERDGIDSAVFYRDAEPLESIILQYYNLLKRLRDR